MIIRTPTVADLRCRSDRRIAAGSSQTTPAIRPATARDIQPLAELFRWEAEVLVKFDPSVHLRQSANWTGYAVSQLKRPHTRVLVAQYRNRLVGLIGIRVVRQGIGRRWLMVLKRSPFRPFVPESDLVCRSGTFGFIEHLYVDPEVRILGVFKRLFDEGMRWLAEQGATEVEGVIWAQNKAVLNLTGKLGFEPVRYLVRKRL